MKLTITLLTVLSSLFFVSCNKATEPAADVTVTEGQAYTSLENSLSALSAASINSSTDLDRISFSESNSLFKKALEGNANSAPANFGAAITEVFGAFADPNINGAIKKWEGSSFGKVGGLQFGIPKGRSDLTLQTNVLAKDFLRTLQIAATDPPTIAQMQQVLRDYLLPRLNYALDRLAVVEGNTSFEFKISGKMQGDSRLSDVYLDGTEVYIMDAMVRMMKAWVEQFLVFRFDMPDYQTKSVVAALQPDNTSFFALATDGTARAQSVKAGLLATISKLRSAVNYLKSETDNQNDDIIKHGTGGISDADLDSTLSGLTKIENSFTNGISTQGTDSDGNTITVQINLSQFYNNPPLNPKSQWFPRYTVDSTATGDIQWHWRDQDYASFIFPDPTFSGVFPGMTNEKLKRLLYLDESFAWKLYVYLNDDDGMMDAGTTASLVVNNKTYTPKPSDNYYSSNYNRTVRFYVLDNPNQTAQLTVVQNSTPISVELNGTAVVTPKSYTYAQIDMTVAPQNITAFAYPGYVYLSFQKYGNYRIQRRTTGSFQSIDSLYSSSYYDNGVQSGTAYQYRVQRAAYAYVFPIGYSFIYGARANNYSNTVSVTAQ
ncbi:MAG: hypothetical protein WBD36_12325 [Bacteroidota bacterium]